MKRRIKQLNIAHQFDARKLDEILDKETVDVTITSPPYFNLKDYEHEEQIGFGQDYDEYLNDLKIVFDKVYKVTKSTGTLWVIIDVFRVNGEVVPLPFDFANKIKEVGWILNEIIIWGKDRTVPWTHKGQMRNMFEYILMFSKSINFKFFIDEVRDHESLKKWWVKYPERYNPKGKSPQAIWNFDIPTQGSWGKGFIKHFCPLPEAMIEQILKISTRENDVVLDCFSGSGAVLSKANSMKRNFIGFDLNKDYIEMFENYLKRTAEAKRREYESDLRNSMKTSKFTKLILELRALKYAGVFHKKLKEAGINNVKLTFVTKSSSQPKSKHSLQVVKYILHIKEKESIIMIKDQLIKLINSAPLSKYGIEPKIYYTADINNFKDKLKKKKLYTYFPNRTYQFNKEIEVSYLTNESKSSTIISDIKLDLDEKQFE